MKTKDDRVGVRLFGEEKRELKRRADKEGISVGAVIRLAVRAFLEPPKKGKA